MDKTSCSITKEVSLLPKHERNDMKTTGKYFARRIIGILAFFAIATVALAPSLQAQQTTKKLTLDSRKNCGCNDATGAKIGKLVGSFENGSLTFKYTDGAIQTNSNTQWNRSTGKCVGGNDLSCWRPFMTTGKPLPGFDAGYSSKTQAVTANKGKSLVVNISGKSDIYIWYQDNACGDNNGSVTYTYAFEDGVNITKIIAYRNRVKKIIDLLAEESKSDVGSWVRKNPIYEALPGAIPGSPIHTTNWGEIVKNEPFSTYPKLIQDLMFKQEQANQRCKLSGWQERIKALAAPGEIASGFYSKIEYQELIGYYTLYLALDQIASQFQGPQYIGGADEMHKMISYKDNGVTVPSDFTKGMNFFNIEKEAHKQAYGHFKKFH